MNKILKNLREKYIAYSEPIIFVVFTLATLSLVWRPGAIGPPKPVKPFEILAFITVILLLIRIFVDIETRNLLKKFKEIKNPLLALGAFLVMVFVSQLNSSFYYSAWQSAKLAIISEYARLIISVVIFLIAIFLTVKYKRRFVFYQLAAVAISPLLLWLAYVREWEPFFIASNRLRGAASDPNYLASWLGLSMLIFVGAFLYTRDWKKWLAMAGIFFVTPLILWTGSRGGWVGVAIGTIFIFLIYIFRDFSKDKFYSVFAVVLILVASAGFGFFTLPKSAQLMVIQRSVASTIERQTLRTLVYHYTAPRNPSVLADGRALGAPDSEVESDPAISYGQDRGELAKIAILRLKNKPLGDGLGYVYWNPLKTLSDGRIQGPHNLFLEVGLSVGYLGLVSWLVFLAFVLFFGTKFKSPQSSILLACLVSLLVASLFLDMLTLRWLWLIMGLLLGQAIIVLVERTN